LRVLVMSSHFSASPSYRRKTRSIRHACLLLLGCGPRPQGLAIAELDHVAIWGTNATVIAHRIRFLTWFPDQIPSHPRFVSNSIHCCPAVERKAQVAIVRGRLLSAVPAWHHHKNEFLFPPRFRQPYYTSTVSHALVHDLHATVVAVKRNGGIQVADVQSQMCQNRAHGYRLLIMPIFLVTQAVKKVDSVGTEV